MRNKLGWAFVGLLVTATLGLGDEGRDDKKSPASCGNHGTSVQFVGTPVEAAKLAREEQKLVFVLHVSGHFEDPSLT